MFSARSIGTGDSYLDSYPFSDSEKSRFTSTFGDRNTVDNLSVSLTNIEITNGLSYAASSIKDAMKTKIRADQEQEREKQRIADEEEEEKEKEREAEERSRSSQRKTEEEQEAAKEDEEEQAEKEREAKEAEEDRKADLRAREEAEKRKQEKINAYDNRVQQQQKENDAIAAASAASSATLLYLLGGVIYDNMGLPGNDLYRGNNIHLNFDFGFGASGFPIGFNSIKTGINRNTGNETLTTDNTTDFALTIDLRLAFRLGYEVENGGGHIFGQFEPGFSPVFTDFNTSYAYGAEAYGGLKNAKLYARYQGGSRNFSAGSLDAEEVGEGGKSSTKYQQVRLGLRFSYYRNSRTAKRDHITLGIMEDILMRNLHHSLAQDLIHLHLF